MKHLSLKIIWAAVALILTGSPAAASAPPAEPTGRPLPFTLSANQSVNGSTLWLEINTEHFDEPVTALSAQYQYQIIPLNVHPVEPGVKYFGLIAIPLA